MIGLFLRSLGAIVAGLAVAMLFAIGVEGVSAVLHPFPPGVDTSDLEVCKAHVARCPAAVLLLAVVGWALGAFASAWTATRLGSGRRAVHGFVVGAVVLASAVTNLLMLPYQAWFRVANLVLIPAAVLWAVRLGRGRRALRRSGGVDAPGAR